MKKRWIINRSSQDKRVAAITGAGGVIGSVIQSKLLDKGWLVRSLSRSSENQSNPNLTVITGDLCDKHVVNTLLQGAEALFHCAAELKNESLMSRVNVTGTQTIIDALRSSSVKYYCHISSAGVVGSNVTGIIHESDTCNPESEYEKTKYAAEKLILSAGLGLSVRILRPTNVVSSAYPGVLTSIIRNNIKDRLIIMMKGSERLHIIHAIDVAAAALYFLQDTHTGCSVYFVGNDEDDRNTVEWVSSYCARLLGNKNYKLSFSIPQIIPHIMRKLVRGKSLHGDTRFSSARLMAEGYVNPLGLEGALKEVCCQRIDGL